MSIRIDVVLSPNFALLDWVHGRTQWTLEVLGELKGVGDYAIEAKARGRVRVHLNVQTQHFIAHLLAVANAVTNPEELFGGVVEDRQHWLYQSFARVGSFVRFVRQ